MGKTNENWYLEFTKSNETIDFNFGDDDILVFYPETKVELEGILKRIKSQSIKTIAAANPYWNANGKMIFDPDGYRIVISDLKCK
jgi:hypothetical protein